MKTNNKYPIDKKRVFLFLFFLFFAVVSNASVIPKDSLKSKYDINDPRNPNCPCHKYQKQADDEYKNWLKNQAREKGVNVSSLDKREDREINKNLFSLFRIKLKRKNKSHPKLIRRIDFKHIKFWKRRTRTDACFHW